MNPPLFSSRTPAQQVLIANIVPAVFGLVVGIMAGVSKPIYLVLSLIALAGAYFAGLEHKYPEEGMLRGVAGGLMFSSFLLLGRAITGLDDKVSIPPGILFVVLAVAISAAGGAFGASRRAKREGRGRSESPAPVGGA